MLKIFKWIQSRFDNVWVSPYPKYWHFINLVLGFVTSIIFIILFDGSMVLKVSLFLPVWVLSSTLILAFTYGILRSRKGWTKKRK